MRRYLFGNEENLTKIIAIFLELFSASQDFDLKNVYFNRILKVVYQVFNIKISYDDIIRNHQLEAMLLKIKQQIDDNWARIRQQEQYVTCLAEMFGKISN